LYTSIDFFAMTVLFRTSFNQLRCTIHTNYIQLTTGHTIYNHMANILHKQNRLFQIFIYYR
uniref:Uncharacterized protein n=1 Tax=Parascaris univalens TaxID=6257 RepID=A0A915B084_PARUN